MMQAPIVSATFLLSFEGRLAFERMTPHDPRDHPPTIEDELRVLVMFDDGSIATSWDWPVAVEWWRVVGFRIEEDGTNEACSVCGSITGQCDEISGDAVCLDCMVNGDWEPDGDDGPPEERAGDPVNA